MIRANTPIPITTGPRDLRNRLRYGRPDLSPTPAPLHALEAVLLVWPPSGSAASTQVLGAGLESPFSERLSRLTRDDPFTTTIDVEASRRAGKALKAHATQVDPNPRSGSACLPKYSRRSTRSISSVWRKVGRPVDVTETTCPGLR